MDSKRQRLAGRILTAGSEQVLDRHTIEARLAENPAAASPLATAHGALWVAGLASAAVLWVGWRVAPRRMQI